MDVTVYPPPPQPLSASDHTRLGQHSYPDPAFGTNKSKVKGQGQIGHREAELSEVSVSSDTD
ncbi:hypothetical protein EYF80_029371 [Liparis tanakae]|uniref:Uncharacterized protein n=1 Tax=Liparis tanakae TaxID=230148 RepID=A0A4Z2H679_9TELE|nr:hypothetical protein EYF80_029371 [Liparis tanakae]